MHTSSKNILEGLLNSMGYSGLPISENEVAGQKIYSMGGGEHAKTLIGSYGDTVHALDYLTKKIAEKQLGAAREEMGGEVKEETKMPEELLFLVDVDEYRTARIKNLQAKGLMLAERARSFQYDV